MTLLIMETLSSLKFSAILSLRARKILILSSQSFATLLKSSRLLALGEQNSKRTERRIKRSRPNIHSSKPVLSQSRKSLNSLWMTPTVKSEWLSCQKRTRTICIRMEAQFQPLTNYFTLKKEGYMKPFHLSA